MPKYKPKFPRIVDIQKVNASPYPRKMDVSTDQSRYNTSKQTYGNHLLTIKGNQTHI